MATITIPTGVTSTGLIIEAGDILNIQEGGSATNTTENGGAVNITDGGYADFIANTIIGLTVNNAVMTVHKNTVANENLFGHNGYLKVYDGGIASGNVLNAGYIGVEVNSGAKVTGTTAFVGSGYFTVYSGGSAENTVYSDSYYWGNHFNVMTGAIVTGTTINNGVIYVQTGAEANATLMAGGQINAAGTLSVFTATGGTLNLNEGGVANDLDLSSATMNVNNGAVASGLVVTERATVNVAAGGKIDGITEVGAYNTINIAAEGTAVKIKETGGAVNVTEGGIVEFVENTITGQTISNYTMTVHSGTTATENTFGHGGILKVYDGGLASGNVLNAGYIGVEVNSGAKVTGTTAYVGSGYFTVYSGGSAENTVYSDSYYWGNHFNVMTGAIVTGTTIMGGRLYVQTGAEANTTLMAGGEINATGTLTGFTATGGTLNVLSGGVLTGLVDITGGNVAIAEGGTFLIDLTSRAPRSAAEVSGIGKVSGTKVITVKVSDTQANGKYVLSANAAGFDGTISVTDSAGVELGTMAVNESVKIGETEYHLVISANSLKLFIGVDVIPSDVYVNDAWIEEVVGSTVALKDGGIGTIGYDAFATADAANAAADPDDGTIHLEAGTISFSSDVHGVVVSNGVTLDLTGTNVASANVLAGGRLTGKMAFGSGAEVAASSGAIIDFDLTKAAAGAETALLNDQSIITGAPLYTLTVNGSEAFGDYKLADGAAGFDKTISVMNTSGEALGILTVGVTEAIGAVEYTLNLSEGGNLTVTLVEGADPTIFTGDLTDATKDILTGSSAVEVNVNSGGSLLIHDGGTAIETTLNQYGRVLVYDGAFVSNTTANNDGQAIVSGGTVNDTVINSGGQLSLSGGVANGVVVDGGNADSGGLWISAGGSANSVTVNPEGYVSVYLGGAATNVVENGGYVKIGDEWGGAQPENVTFLPNSFSGLVLDRKWTTVHSGTTATDITVNSSGLFRVLSGGTANSNTVNSIGRMYLYNGGTANGNTVNSGGTMFVSGGTANGNTVNSGGSMYVFSGGVANRVTVNTDGQVIVSSGGFVNGATLLSHGDSGGLWVVSGGTAADIVNDEGYLEIRSGGTAERVTVDNDGIVWGSSGARLNSVTVNPGAYFGISSGGTATNIVENGGYFKVEDGADVEILPNTFSGVVLSGGDTPWATVHSGTTATDTTVGSDGLLRVFSGGLASGFTIQSGGSLVMFSGAHLTGKITLEDGAIVSNFESSAILDFDLTQTSAGASPFVNDLSYFPACDFALTIDGTEAAGTYSLASGAAGFDSMIYVYSPGWIPGWIMPSFGLLLDSPVTVGTTSYLLTLTDDVLAVNISLVSPDDVFVNSEWAGLPDGTSVTPIPGGDAATIGYDAFADVNDAFAEVAEDGEVHVVGGTVSFGGAVDKSVTIGDGVTLTGKAAFNSSILIDGTIVFDTENAVDGPQFTGFENVELGDGAKFTLNATPKAVGTAITLATGAAELFKRKVTYDDFDFVVGAPHFFVAGGIESYVLDLDADRNLVLSYVACENKSDGDAKNGYLVKKKDVNPHIGELQSNMVDEFSRVLLDDKGTVFESGNYNFVGGDDKADYAKITMASAAKLRFSFKAKDSADKIKFSLVSYNAATGKTKTLKSASTSKGKEGLTAAVFVDPNDPKTAGLQYFVAVENKGKTNVFYNVELTDDSDFYVDADNGHNNSLVEKKVLNPFIDEFANTAVATGGKTFIQLDADDFIVDDRGDYVNWVGFGDATDFARISPSAPAILNFTLNGKFDVGATPASLKLTVYSLTLNSKGVWTQKVIKSKTLNMNKGESVSTGILYLDRLNVPEADHSGRTGYYVSVQSTNAKKGGEAYYCVSTTGNVYNDADYSIANVSGNGWLFNKKDNAVNGELMASYVGTYAETWIDFDYDVCHDEYYNFVGFGDTCDYSEIYVDEEGLYNFKIDTTGKAKFTVYSMTRKNGKWTQKVLGSQTISDVNGAKGATLKKDVKLSTTNDDLRYFVSMQATDTKKSPEVYYNVMSFLTAVSVADALAMPETDSLGISDSLSLGQYDTDVLAGTYLDSASDKLFGESGNGLLASL